MQIKDLKLQEAKPSDRPHVLLWDTLNDLELQQLAYRNQAFIVSYRSHLKSRINLQSRFLALHHQLERELDVIKAVCADTHKPVVLLKDLDCLITYLQVQPESPTSIFWQSLLNTRHLKSILWLILPSKLAPSNWHHSRIQCISQESE